MAGNRGDGRASKGCGLVKARCDRPAATDTAGHHGGSAGGGPAPQQSRERRKRPRESASAARQWLATAAERLPPATAPSRKASEVAEGDRRGFAQIFLRPSCAHPLVAARPGFRLWILLKPFWDDQIRLLFIPEILIPHVRLSNPRSSFVHYPMPLLDRLRTALGHAPTLQRDGACHMVPHSLHEGRGASTHPLWECRCFFGHLGR